MQKLKQDIKALNNLLTNFILCLQNDLKKLKLSKTNKNMLLKKHFIEILQKAINIVGQLKKLNQEEACNDEVLSEKDKVIINDYFNTYLKKIDLFRYIN